MVMWQQYFVNCTPTLDDYCPSTKISSAKQTLGDAITMVIRKKMPRIKPMACKVRMGLSARDM